MRFPQIPFMQRVFGLFDLLDITAPPSGQPPTKGSLIRYIYAAEDAEGDGSNIMCFNGKCMTASV